YMSEACACAAPAPTRASTATAAIAASHAVMARIISVLPRRGREKFQPRRGPWQVRVRLSRRRNLDPPADAFLAFLHHGEIKRRAGRKFARDIAAENELIIPLVRQL